MLEARSTVVHVALSVDRLTLTETSGFDHVIRIEPQSSAMADAPSVVGVVGPHPPAGQASQTLWNGLRYERPPLDACPRQARALRRIPHVVRPLPVVRQQITWSGLPHTERRAQLTTTAAQDEDKVPERTAPRATFETHDR
jgi:hypothetical protein